jgi:protein SDA1
MLSHSFEFFYLIIYRPIFYSFNFFFSSTKMKRKVELVSNLAQLQNLIKRDPKSYELEFDIQFNHFLSEMEIFKLKPDSPSDAFQEQIMFIAAVAPCYPKKCEKYPSHIMDLLASSHQTMSPDIRKTMVQALILMRNRNLIAQSEVLSLFFTLFRCKDKILRQLLHTHIVSDIKNANAKAKNNKLNKTLQNFMYKMLQDPSEIAAKKSLEVMIELYHKNVWNDAKTVNVISEACLSTIPKLVAPSIHFFLGTNDHKYDSDDEDDEGPSIDSLRHANSINKKRKSRENQLERAHAKIKRVCF